MATESLTPPARELLAALPLPHCGADLTALTEPLAGYSALAINTDILRLDRLDAVLSGNKLFKLAGHLAQFASGGRRCLLSFGGPFSNHLHALAAAGQRLGIPVVLIVRGYQQLPLTPTLADCVSWGAQLVFADRRTYARRYDPDWQQQLAAQYDALVIPEGGGGEAGLSGCRVIGELAQTYDQLWLAVGSGTTALGLAPQVGGCEIVGVNAVADQGERRRHWQQTMPAAVRWRLLDDAHCGGFARRNDALMECIRRWDAAGLALDPVYTGKLMLAYERALARGDLAGQRVLLIHSGGLQGRRGVAGLDLPGVKVSPAGADGHLHPASGPA